MLKIANLSFSIGEADILKEIDLDLRQGQLHAVIGPNGSGKSTLLKNICGIWPLSSGQVWIEGENIVRIPRKKLSRKVTFVPQNTWLTFPVTVRDLVLMGRNPHLTRFQRFGPRDWEIVNRTLESVDLLPLKSKLVTELSGGELQRAWIAGALATQAPLMLLDEPTSLLDIKHKLMIFRLLKSFKKRGLTIVVVIHELNFAYNFFDTVTVLQNGKIYKSGKTREIMTPGMIKEVFKVNATCIKHQEGEFLYFR